MSGRAIILLLAVALVAPLTTAFELTEEEDVAVLTPSNFQEFVNQVPLTLVEFYAPWCGHCKSLAPEWAKAAKRAKKLAQPVPLAKVDADAHKELAEKYSVTGYPTIKWFMEGAPMDYDGPRDADGILEAIRKQMDYSPPVHVKDAAEMKALVDNLPRGECILVGFWREPVQASAAYKVFASSAFELSSDCSIAWSASAPGKEDPAAAELGSKDVPGLAVVSRSSVLGTTAIATTKLPRNKAEFTTDFIAAFVQKHAP